MSELTVGLLGVGVLFVAIMLGVHVALALGLVGSIGLVILSSPAAATSILGSVFFSTTASFHFSVVPMFLLMGFFAMQAGLGQDLFAAAVKWLGRLPGGLAIATTGGAAAFGAASGSSVGSAMLFTKLALPEMLRYGYDKRLASASIAISGTLAVLIPPSALMVLFAILTDASIGRLLLAGLVPGLVFTLVICLATLAAVLLKPALAPRSQERFTWGERFASIRLVGPLAGLIALIVGGLYFGVFTPAEAGAIGAALTFLLALIRQRGLRGIRLPQALLETVQTTSMVFSIIISALVFSRFLAYSGLTDMLSQFLTTLDVNRWVIVVIIGALYIVLGMIMDAPAMLAVTLPIVDPVMRNLGFDVVWTGVFVVILCELGAITPPVGMNCFVVKGAAGDAIRLEDVFAGIIPYVIACLAMLVLIAVFPQLVLYLPSTMR